MKVFVEGLRLGRGGNDRPGHWSQTHRKRAGEKSAVSIALYRAYVPTKVGQGPAKARFQEAAGAWPWKVTITRQSPSAKPLDKDNCAASCKAVQDEIAAWLGVDDGDRKRVSWDYQSARGPWAVVIEVEAAKGAKAG